MARLYLTDLRVSVVIEGMARGWRVWTALWIVYIVWGSTYFAIKVSVRTLPPLLSAGMRFIARRLLLAVVSRLGGRRCASRGGGRGAAAGLGVALLTLRRRGRHARRDADRLERRSDDRRARCRCR